jgi:tRNA(adenine34) deaminase
MSGNFTEEDLRWMQEALEDARQAEAAGEVPVGAVIVKDGRVIGRGGNRRQYGKDPTAHAEMVAIRQAAEEIGDWRLEHTTLYVTLEPCPMCAGAIVLARIPRVVYGARDPKAGAVGSLMNLLDDSRLNHRAEVVQGVLAGECGEILSDYFLKLRQRNNRKL